MVSWILPSRTCRILASILRILWNICRIVDGLKGMLEGFKQSFLGSCRIHARCFSIVLSFWRIFAGSLQELFICCSLKWISGQNDFKLVWFGFSLFRDYGNQSATKGKSKQTSLKSFWPEIHFKLQHIHSYVHTCTPTHIHTNIHACMHACIHIHMYTFMHTHTYRHTYMQSQKGEKSLRIFHVSVILWKAMQECSTDIILGRCTTSRKILIRK